MRGNVYKIIAGAFVLVLILGEAAMLFMNSSQGKAEEGLVEGVVDVHIEAWKPYVRLYGSLPEDECIKSSIKGNDYYVVEFSNPLCAFLYNTSISTTLSIENNSLSLYLPPIALPGYHIKADVKAKTYQGSVVALYRFQPVGERKAVSATLKALREETSYVYRVPFENRSLLRELGLGEFAKDVVLVNNSSLYANNSYVKAVGEGYVVVFPNVTSLEGTGIEGTPIPSVVEVEEPVEELEPYLDRTLTTYILYSDGSYFVPPTPYKAEGGLTLPAEAEVEGFLSGNVFLEVYGLSFKGEGNTPTGEE